MSGLSHVLFTGEQYLPRNGVFFPFYMLASYYRKGAEVAKDSQRKPLLSLRLGGEKHEKHRKNNAIRNNTILRCTGNNHLIFNSEIKNSKNIAESKKPDHVKKQIFCNYRKKF